MSFRSLSMSREEEILHQCMVFDKLSKLKPFKSPGPDGIHPYTLKECSISICRPLCMLYNHR